ncbi:MAG: M60 family metallopeptidase [Akkermansiaceae bacterium]
MLRLKNTLAALAFLLLATAARAQTIADAFAQLKNHINGTTNLSATQIKEQSAIITANRTQLGNDAAVIAGAIDLVNTYETLKNPLFTGWPTKREFTRDEPGFELPQAMFTLQQQMLDWTYTANSLAAHENLLDGWLMKTSSYFPGSVAPPADPAASHTVLINASQPDAYGAPVMYETNPARRPTGTYLAPGSIGVVTVPAALINKGFAVRVGAHSWDLSNKTALRRLDRVTSDYPITSVTTKIASPLGGGIYIEVPYLANEGIISIQISNAVRSPFFSATAHRPATTLSEWQNTERTQPGPWADFETDKFMMQVPRSWIYAYANPVALMQDWDKAMDAVSDLFGLPRVRSKTVMYTHADVIFRVGVNAPGYPMSNDTYNPFNATNGNQGNWMLTGPKTAPWTHLHELGHAQLFTKFTGETESAVNLLKVAVLNQKFGMSLDQAFGTSIGDEMNLGVSRRYASLLWILKNQFRNGTQRMLDADMKYQHRGHGKYVEIAGLFGWQALGDFWHSVHEDYENGIDYPENTDPTDSRILRMSKAAGADLRPLLHFWGVPPLNANNLQTAINTAGLMPSGLIYQRLKYYQSIVPANLTQYKAFYNIVRQTGADDEIVAMNTSYTPAIGTSTVNAIQAIIDLYFPNGDPTAIDQIWDIIPGNGAIDTGSGTWDTTTANWTTNNGANNVTWTNGGGAVFDPGTYTVNVASALAVGNLTVKSGGGTVTLKALTDNDGISVNPGSTWYVNDNTLLINADSVKDTKLTLTSGATLSVTGNGTFSAGEKPTGADWGVTGCTLDIQGAITLRGTGASVGKFANVRLAEGSSFIHEADISTAYDNNWQLDGEGQIYFDNRYNRFYRLNGLISGTAGITIGNLGILSGTPQYLRLDNIANTYTGRTVVLAGGILRLPNGLEASIGANPGSFTPDQLELDGGTLEQTFTPALVIDDANRGLTLGTNSGSVSATGTLTLATPITGPGSLNVKAGTVIVSNAANNYTGDTIVTAGTLQLSNPTLANTATVRLSSTATLTLNFVGSDTVRALTLNNLPQETGTWGALDSSAFHKTARITGSGILNVVGDRFQQWALLAGLDGTLGKESGFADDPNQNGIPNGLEWILGGTPLGVSPPTTQHAVDAGHLTFSFTRNDISEEDTTLHLQWSDSLSAWTDVFIGSASSEEDENGVTVAIAENGSDPDSVTVTIPRDLGNGQQLFVRLLARTP